MDEREQVINDLNVARLLLCNPQILDPQIRIRIGQTITSSIDLLTEQGAIIEQYHKADTFLEAHGWKWEGR